MPITRLPIVHKFGIISQSQREDLQARLYHQSLRNSRIATTRGVVTANRNPTNISDSFLHQFNSATTTEEKSELEEAAFKILARTKRRAGLQEGGLGKHVNIPKAWADLSLLAQCQGKVQEETLDVLITSLNQAPLSIQHIPSLFYLAETTLYWLRTDALTEPYLRTGEIKLLRMGQLVFTRLYFHHMCGHMQGHLEFKNRLATYLDGYNECQQAYCPYPGAHLALRFIVQVGIMVVGNEKTEAGEVKQGDKLDGMHMMVKDEVTKLEKDQEAGKMPAGSQISMHDLSPTLWHSLDVWRCAAHLSSGLEEACAAMALCGSKMAAEHWVDTVIAIQVLSEAARVDMRALKTLQNLARGYVPTQNNSGEGQRAEDQSETDSNTSDLSMDSSTASHGDGDSEAGSDRVDSGKDVFSPMVESSAKLKASSGGLKPGLGRSKSSSVSLKVNVGLSRENTQDLLLTSLSSCGGGGPEDNRSSRTGTGTPPDISSGESRLDSAGGIGVQEPGEESTSEDSDLEPGDESETEARSEDLTRAQPASLATEGAADGGQLGQAQMRSSLSSGGGRLRTPKSVTIDPVPNTTYAEAGDTHRSEADLVTEEEEESWSNDPVMEIPGIQGWKWEAGFMYVEALSYVCLHGITSNIQKTALVGFGKRNNDYRVRTRKPLASAGIMDFVEFVSGTESNSKGHRDWSWRVRYSAVQCLVKISRCLSGDTIREGLRTVAWNTMMRCQSKETDDRVLEALKVGQVEAELEHYWNQGDKRRTSACPTLGSKMAAGLASVYLPSLPPPVESPRHTKPPPKYIAPPKTITPSRKGPIRTSLRQEITLATSLQEKPINYNTRTSLDLNRIVEDQWRKELQESLEVEEKEKQKELEKYREHKEKLEMEKDSKRNDKFHRKNTVLDN